MSGHLALLRAAGESAQLVARPRGVAHVYVGPLTPSGRYVPRTGRTVCRARTRRLSVLESTPVALDPTGKPACRLCTARLAHVPRQGEAGPTSRDQVLTAYDGITAFDLAIDAFMAETPAEVERLEWLALLLVGFPACHRTPVVSPAGKVSDPLDHHIRRARTRVGATRDHLGVLRAAADDNHEAAVAAAKAARHDAWKDRDDRITRLGFVNATSA